MEEVSWSIVSFNFKPTHLYFLSTSGHDLYFIRIGKGKLCFFFFFLCVCFKENLCFYWVGMFLWSFANLSIFSFTSVEYSGQISFSLFLNENWFSDILPGKIKLKINKIWIAAEWKCVGHRLVNCDHVWEKALRWGADDHGSMSMFEVHRASSSIVPAWLKQKYLTNWTD